MDNKGSVNYKTAAEFNEAMYLAFRTALAQTPDEPALQSVSDKIAAAAAAWAAYDAAVSTAQHAALSDGPAAVPGDAIRLEKTARQVQEGADIALKKWYSGQWLRRQSRRGVL